MQFGGRQVKSIEVEAVIIRANGRREPLGTIGFWHANPLRRWAWRIKRWLGRKRGGAHGS